MSSEPDNVDEYAIDFCFLGNERLLVVVRDKMKLFSIGDMSQAPQFLACFLFPVPVTGVAIACNLQPRMQAQQTTWISDPTDQLLSIYMFEPTSTIFDIPTSAVFVIHTRIFFDLDLFEATAAPIAWQYWGPSNTRAFDCDQEFSVTISGNRVLQERPVDDVHSSADDDSESDDMGYRFHMMDFSPLAVKHHQGLGRVVKEPSETVLAGQSVKTFLPYVEVVSERRFYDCGTRIISVDEDRIYLLVNFYGVGSSHF
jgi:hypothetical protein